MSTLRLLLTLSLLAGSLNGADPSIGMLGRTYKLGSYTDKPHAMWEFVAPGENINSWKSLVTLLERSDVTSLKQVDGVAEGMQTVYKNNGGAMITARSERDPAGKPYDYMVVALKASATMTEVNFIKVSLGEKTGQVLIYAVRISDPKDPNIGAKAYYEKHAAEIEKALAATPVQPVGTLPRRVF